MTRGSRARKIFVSYSREGGQAHAVSLFQGLTQVLGEKAIFLDVGQDAMEAGRSWKETVKNSLSKCDTLLLVFDPGMTARLADPESPVLFELETALKHNITIACVRVDGAGMPISSDLPSSLSNFSEWHSPEIHSDAVVADIERVIKELTGRVPGQVPLVDRWDLVILGVLGVLGLAAWFSAGRSLLNLCETWLWGGALFVPWLIWMAGRRRVFAIGNRGRASLSKHQAGNWLAVLIVFGSGLLLFGWNIYGVDELPAEGGILVARLDGDPSDSEQISLVDKFIVETEASVDYIRPPNAARLPRRIGFSPFTSYSGHTAANLAGTRAQAAVVLWGSLQPPKGTAPARLKVSLTFIRSEGLFKRLGSELGGPLGSNDIDELNGELDLLADTLTEFLKAYSGYHSATSEKDLVGLMADFGNIITTIENENGSTEDTLSRRALNEIKKSVHFYRGNTLLALDRKQEAISEYQKAVVKMEDEVGGSYIEASNNLGWLLKDEEDISQAKEILHAAVLTCNKRDNQRHRACAYVSYNLGNALSDQDLYKEASDSFNEAIDRIQKVDTPDNTDTRFYASSQQYLAYSFLRRAAADAPNKAELLRKAEEALNSGIDALNLAEPELDVPEYFDVTLARIHIEGGEWRRAIDRLTAIGVLANTDAPERRRANVQSLLAGAYWCDSDIEKALKHLNDLAAAANDDQAGDDFREMNFEALEEAMRIQNMCSETEQTGGR